MGSIKRVTICAGLVVAAAVVFVPAALAQGNTDRAHTPCSHGGGIAPVMGSADGGGISGLENPGADHGAAGAMASNANAGGAAQGGRFGGLGGSSLRGGGAGGCRSGLVSLPATGAPVQRLALWGVALVAIGGASLLMVRADMLAPEPTDERALRRRRYEEIRDRIRSGR